MCAKIMMSCVLLHNYCLRRHIPLPDIDEEDEEEDDVDDPPPVENVNIGHGQAVRAELVENIFPLRR